MRRARNYCLLLMLPLAVRSMPGTGSGGGIAPRPKAEVHSQSTPKGGTGGTAGARTTAEPQPPLGISAQTTALQRNVRGGVATILVKIDAGVPIEEAVLSARTPSRVVFADGSASRTWKIDLASGGTVAIPIEILVPEDGRYSIAAEVKGKAQGKTIKRALHHKLTVGAKERKGKKKDGAIEYPAAEVVTPEAPEAVAPPAEPSREER